MVVTYEKNDFYDCVRMILTNIRMLTCVTHENEWLLWHLLHMRNYDHENGLVKFSPILKNVMRYENFEEKKVYKFSQVSWENWDSHILE